MRWVGLALLLSIPLAGPLSAQQKYVEPELTARDREHWAFQKPVKPPVPKVRRAESAIRNPIDNFILARLARDGIKPSPEADRFTLLRRVSDATAPGDLPTLFTALQEQLGLKLEAGRAPVQTVVIDHIERPAAD